MRVNVLVYNVFYRILRECFFEHELQGVLPKGAKGQASPKIWKHKRLDAQGRSVIAAVYLFLGNGVKHPAHFHRKIGIFKSIGSDQGDIDALAFFKALKYIEVCKTGNKNVINKEDISPNPSEPIDFQADSLYEQFKEEHQAEISLFSNIKTSSKLNTESLAAQSIFHQSLDDRKATDDDSPVVFTTNQFATVLAYKKQREKSTANYRAALDGAKFLCFFSFYRPKVDNFYEDDKQFMRWPLDIAVLEFKSSSALDLDCSLTFARHMNFQDHDCYKGKTDFARSTESELLVQLNLDAIYKNFPIIAMIDFMDVSMLAEHNLYIGNYLMVNNVGYPAAFVLRQIIERGPTIPQYHEIPFYNDRSEYSNAFANVDSRILDFFSEYHSKLWDFDDFLANFKWKFYGNRLF